MYLANRGYAPRPFTNTDVDLLSLGWIEPVSKPGFRGYIATPEGTGAFTERRRQQSVKFDKHNTLATRLARYLQDRNRITWENIELTALFDNRSRPCRPDVFSMMCTYKATKLHPFIHEVKVSRTDFLNEVKNTKKLSLYSQLAERVFFACPEGLISKKEVPEGYGLIYEKEQNVFSLVKRAAEGSISKYRTAMWMRLVLKQGQTLRARNKV